MIPLLALFATLLLMLAEQWRSRSNEHILRQRGASEPAGDVYRAMAWVYPAMFVAMAFEGLTRSGTSAAVGIGLIILVVAKALKYWAIATLGERWTFRVLVPPGAPLVRSGPYRWLRHPNYVAVFGELIGFAVLVGAPGLGIVSCAVFGQLLRQRIKVEERALGGT